jgi:hypothetical protein
MGTARMSFTHGNKRARLAGFERICRYQQTCTLGATA